MITEIGILLDTDNHRFITAANAALRAQLARPAGISGTVSVDMYFIKEDNALKRVQFRQYRPGAMADFHNTYRMFLLSTSWNNAPYNL